MTIQKLPMNKWIQICEMCKGPRNKGSMYEWIGDITGKRLKICRKCALKDLGTKKGKERLEEIDNE